MLFLLNYIFAAEKKFELIDKPRLIVKQGSPENVVMVFANVSEGLSELKAKADENGYVDYGSTEEERQVARKLVETAHAGFLNLYLESKSNPSSMFNLERLFEEFMLKLTSFNGPDVLNKILEEINYLAELKNLAGIEVLFERNEFNSRKNELLEWYKLLEKDDVLFGKVDSLFVKVGSFSAKVDSLKNNAMFELLEYYKNVTLVGMNELFLNAESFFESFELLKKDELLETIMLLKKDMLLKEDDFLNEDDLKKRNNLRERYDRLEISVKTLESIESLLKKVKLLMVVADNLLKRVDNLIMDEFYGSDDSFEMKEFYEVDLFNSTE